jgi:predicted permease
MSWSKLAFRFPWRRARDIRRDVAEELQIHIDQRVDELVAGGMPVAKALHTARVQFGDVRATEQYCIAQDKGAERQRERQRWLGDLARDLRHGWRAMRRRPGFSALAALTLALGIGGTTAIGTVIYRLVVRPFDMPGGTRIVILTETQPGSRVQLIPSPTTLAAWKEGATGSFESLESTESVQLAVAGEDGLAAQFVRGLGASPGLGAMLHMRPEIGRWFLPGEYGTSPAQVVVLSHRMWRDRFGQAPDIVGLSITLNGDRYEVIGILPRSGDDPPVSYLAADLWLPAMDWLAGSGRRGTRGIAVLSPGVTREQATARLEVVAAQMAESDPRFETWKPKVTPASQLIGESTRSGMLVLLGASGLLLLLGCANVAQMLLARGVERRQEFGVRAALGASRGRLVRQALAEHAALGLVGGMAGAGVAMILLKLTVDQLPPTLSVLRSFQPGPGLLLGAIGLGLVTVLLFGLYPALEAAFRLSRTSNGQLVPSAQIGSGNRGRSDCR